jgi:hypothetical protein
LPDDILNFFFTHLSEFNNEIIHFVISLDVCGWDPTFILTLNIKAKEEGHEVFFRSIMDGFMDWQYIYLYLSLLTYAVVAMLVATTEAGLPEGLVEQCIAGLEQAAIS